MLRTKRSVLLALLATGLLAVGCSNGGNDDDVASLNGDDDSESADSESDKEAEEQKLYDWVDCMQEEGIPVGDPTRDADGNLQITDGPVQMSGGGDGPSVQSKLPGDEEDPEADFTPEDMDAAEDVCGDIPLMTSIREEPSEAEIEEMQENALAFAKCMREEAGIEDFEDPDFSQGGPGGAPQNAEGGPGSVEGGPPEGSGPAGVISGPFGTIDMSDPEMVAGYELCSDNLGEDIPPLPEGAPGDGNEGAGT